MDVTNFQKNLPMYLTLSRVIAAIPLSLAIYIGPPWAHWPAAIIFILASITDWLDGYFARKYKTESTMGKFMDPIADKILVLAALILLLDLHRIDPILVILLLGRDTLIGGVRSVAATKNVIIAAKPFGKWKTALQMISIPCLLIYEPRLAFGINVDVIGYIGLWLSVILSMISGVQYTLGYFKENKKEI